MTSVTITAKGDKIAWSDVLAGLARAKGYDDESLKGLLPDSSFNPNKVGAKLTILGLNAALGPAVTIDTVEAQGGNNGALRITLDRVAQLSSKRRFKQWMQGRLIGWMKRPKTDFGIHPDKDWQKAPLDQPLVIVIHGLQSSPSKIDDVCKEFRKVGMPCGVFQYPNDQPLADSAKLLSDELEKIARAQPDRRVALVTHSMGGLIARAVVEDDELDRGNVSHLMMVAPPNQGSQLAQFAFSLEISEFVRVLGKKQKVDQLFRRIEDGLGDAADDLEPGSPFLKKLNGSPRNPVIRYAIFLGTGGPLTEESLQTMRKSVLGAGRKNRFVRFFGPKLESALDDLDEVVTGKGDGAVSLKRGRLAGVDDVLIFDFAHSDVFVDSKSPTEMKLRQAIVERLKNKAGKVDGTAAKEPKE